MNKDEGKILTKSIKDILIFPEREYRYQFSIHLAPTNNKKTISTENRYVTINNIDYRSDKRTDIEYCRCYYGKAVRKYILDYLNPNRSRYMFFAMAIIFERDMKNDPYHLHIAMEDIPNNQYFISKRNRTFFADVLGIFDAEQLTEDHKVEFFHNLFHSIHYREYPDSKPMKMIGNSKRTYHMKEKSKKDIMTYLSKSKYQYSWNPDWASGFDETNSILIPKDLKR
jgi:hypothetical protein